jgi:hypothetical protein
MKQWEVWDWEFPHGKHPAIILSPEARCSNRDIATVNVLGCSSKRANRKAEVHEVLLDRADGLDWETLCRCDVLFLANKAELTRKRGAVSLERRREIGQTVIRLFALWLG